MCSVAEHSHTRLSVCYISSVQSTYVFVYAHKLLSPLFYQQLNHHYEVKYDSLRAVPGSQVSVDVLVSRQILHPTGNLETHDHQSLANLLHLQSGKQSSLSLKQLATS